ncbi:MAG: Phosphotransferase enzyme [Thelocarpon impressellum]|nr:MAG: Phosphotransferase enzyme [Thelocarpon impressellum]
MTRMYSNATTKPALRKANEDGSEETMDEADLFRYTRDRWLSGEPQKLARRYRSFNLHPLLDAAVRSAGHGAKSCVKVLKCVEGLYNKPFILTMDNGAEIFAKLPNPNAGPTFFTTASEVATRHLLRKFLSLPLPQVLTWSADASNPVGAEYILEEKAPGTPLGSLWQKWPRQLQRDLVTQVVDIVAKLDSLSFPQHGCIYFMADLEAQGLPAESLTATFAGQSPPTQADPFFSQFALGPLTEAGFWGEERAHMTLDRGPWASATEYAEAVIGNEIKWTESYARPRTNYLRSMGSPEHAEDYLSLLRRFLLLAPHLSPPASTRQHVRTLSHPDLHLDNVFVNAAGKISAVIDWQSTCVSELFLQQGLPPMLPHADSSDAKETGHGISPDSESDKVPVTILHHYLDLTKERNLPRWEALSDGHRSDRMSPLELVTSAWAREDVFSFRHALINFVAHWNELAPGCGPCPVDFTEAEREGHLEEMELMEVLRAFVHHLQDENLIPVGGMVRSGHFERCRALNRHFMESFVSLAKDDSERAMFAHIWPYREGDE